MGWLIAIGILLLLAILPLGVSARYNAQGAVLQAIAGPVRITLLPRKGKHRKPKKKEKGSSESAAPAKNTVDKNGEESGGSWKDFLPLVRVGLDFLGDFRRKLRVDQLEIKLIMAGGDPADLGISYGRTWEALGNLWPQIERLFVIKKRDVQVECDFTSDQTRIFARLRLTITLGRLAVLIMRYGIRAVKEYLKIKKQGKGGAVK